MGPKVEPSTLGCFKVQKAIGPKVDLCWAVVRSEKRSDFASNANRADSNSDVGGQQKCRIVASEENIADVCTKPLAKTKFLKFREKLRMDQKLMRIRDREEAANSVDTKSGACQTKHSQGASALLYLLI